MSEPTTQVEEKAVEGVDFDGNHYDQLDGITPEQRDHWLRTGEVPKTEPAEAEEKKPAKAEEKPAEKAPESQAGTGEEDKSNRGFARLRTRNRELESKNRELESRLSALEEAAKKPAPAAEPPAAAAESAKPAASDKLKTALAKIDADFKAGKYETYEEYADARADARAEAKLEGFRAQLAEGQKQATAQQQMQEAARKLAASVEAARTVHPDFDDVIGLGKEGGLGDKNVIPQGSVIEGWVIESPVGTEMLYYFGQNRPELKRIQGLSPFAQSRELTKLEDKLSPKSSPPPQVTKAPEPVRELSGGRVSPPDASDRAVRENDFKAFQAAENEKALARARAGRG